MIGRYFNKLVFSEHPYANPVSGDSDSIATISIEELRTFHQAYYQPSNMIINVVSDFDVADMPIKLNKAFGSWQTTETKVQPDLSQG